MKKELDLILDQLMIIHSINSNSKIIEIPDINWNLCFPQCLVFSKILLKSKCFYFFLSKVLKTDK